MATVAEVFAAAIKAHQEGNVDQAEQLYRLVTTHEPAHAEAWNGLGIALHQKGKGQDALFSFQRAISLEPAKGTYYTNIALALAAQGKRNEAMQMLARAVSLDPNDAKAFGQLGFMHVESEEWSKAHEYLYRAHALDNNNPQVLLNLGQACKMLGYNDDALLCFKTAVERNPQDAHSWNGWGIQLREQGKLEEAIAAYRRAIELQPRLAPSYTNLGNVYVQMAQAAPAAEAYRKSLQLDPAQPEVYYQLARCVYTLGRKDDAIGLLQEAIRRDPRHVRSIVALSKRLVEMDRLPESIEVLQRGVQLLPDDVDLLMETGVWYFDRKKYAEGLKWYTEALKRKPDSADLLVGIGTCYHYLEQFAPAEECYRRALAIRPDFVTPTYNLGLVMHEQSRLPEAIAAYDRTIQLQPDHSASILNRSMAILYSGNWERGWQEYENRWLVYEKNQFPRPQWQGEPLQGKTILVHYEQGFGDTLQFCRYLPMVKALGARVLFLVQPSLVPLMKTLQGPDLVFGRGDPIPNFDVHVPLLSLPLLFKTRPENIPHSIPYLAAEPERVARWGEALKQVTGIRIGISWQGSQQDPFDSLERHPRKRSCPLAAFGRLARIPGVSLISLQKGDGSDQLRQVPFPVITIPDLDAQGGFLDTAAIVKNLQLMISIDSAVIHIAGALGAPVWVALPYTADWRWMQKFEDTPWYRSMRLFRQPKPGDWTSVFERIGTMLEQAIAQTAAAPAARPAAAPQARRPT